MNNAELVNVLYELVRSFTNLFHVFFTPVKELVETGADSGFLGNVISALASGFLGGVFGDLSLFSIMLGSGIASYLIWQFLIWVINIVS